MLHRSIAHSWRELSSNKQSVCFPLASFIQVGHVGEKLRHIPWLGLADLQFNRK